MRLSGYAITDLPPEQIVSSPLAEITLSASPDELRAMARFLAACADEMDRMGDRYDHVHLSDRIKRFEGAPHVVVMRA